VLSVENKGIGNCAKNPNRPNCVNETMYSLDTFVEKFVSPNLPINYLSVDQSREKVSSNFKVNSNFFDFLLTLT
jgi:hypothetical protein